MQMLPMWTIEDLQEEDELEFWSTVYSNFQFQFDLSFEACSIDLYTVK